MTELMCSKFASRWSGTLEMARVGRGEKASTPTHSALLRKQPVSLRADFVLTKVLNWPYERRFYGKTDRDGSCSRAALSLVRTKSALSETGCFPSKAECVGMGAFFPLPEHAVLPQPDEQSHCRKLGHWLLVTKFWRPTRKNLHQR